MHSVLMTVETALFNIFLQNAGKHSMKTSMKNSVIGLAVTKVTSDPEKEFPPDIYISSSIAHTNLCPFFG